MPAAHDQTIPANEAVAYVLMFVGVLLPATVYWQYGGAELFGAHPVLKLLVGTACCGAVGLAFYAGARGWQRAILPGALAGAGASGLQVAYLELFERTSAHTGELVLVSFLGAVPGLLLFALIRPKARR